MLFFCVLVRFFSFLFLHTHIPTIPIPIQLPIPLPIPIPIPISLPRLHSHTSLSTRPPPPQPLPSYLSISSRLVPILTPSFSLVVRTSHVTRHTNVLLVATSTRADDDDDDDEELTDIDSDRSLPPFLLARSLARRAVYSHRYFAIALCPLLFAFRHVLFLLVVSL
ncbi:hypothetical protein FRC18_006899 [Serendipita sp. 400]|nr:hypothetical protein FRC18_006899 [Serendipita sp. 400]